METLQDNLCINLGRTQDLRSMTDIFTLAENSICNSPNFTRNKLLGGDSHPYQHEKAWQIQEKDIRAKEVLQTENLGDEPRVNI